MFKLLITVKKLIYNRVIDAWMLQQIEAVNLAMQVSAILSCSYVV